MPGHLTDRWSNGGHTWELLWGQAKPIDRLNQDLHLDWDATEVEEWRDRPLNP